MDSLNPQNRNVQDLNSPEHRIRLENQMKGGLSWFYWIAGLSFINQIIFILGSNINFVVGLGITQIVSVLFQELGFPIFISFIINFIFIGMFILFGYFSMRNNPIIIIGIILYALDSILFLFAKDFWSFGFHIFAIIGLISGYLAKLKFDSLMKSPEISNIEKKEN